MDFAVGLGLGPISDKYLCSEHREVVLPLYLRLFYKIKITVMLPDT